jgi:hypothetical protein
MDCLDKERPSMSMVITDPIFDLAYTELLISCQADGCLIFFPETIKEPASDPVDIWAIRMAQYARESGWSSEASGKVLCPEHTDLSKQKRKHSYFPKMSDPQTQREQTSLKQLGAVAQARQIRLQAERQVLAQRERHDLSPPNTRLEQLRTLRTLGGTAQPHPQNGGSTHASQSK